MTIIIPDLEHSNWKTYHDYPRMKRNTMAFLRLLSHDSIGAFTPIYCDEHQRHELVPSVSYTCELHIWYACGLHPRFSLINKLLEKKQRVSEIWRLLCDDHFRTATQGKKTVKSFLLNFDKAIEPHLFTWLNREGRRYRVTVDFKSKFEKKLFTPQDFLDTFNQERRRLIASTLTNFSTILEKMGIIAKDDVGALYVYSGARYLHVTCPSTGQEYLLNVPNGMQTPKEAKDWTFGFTSPVNFVQET